MTRLPKNTVIVRADLLNAQAGCNYAVFSAETSSVEVYMESMWPVVCMSTPDRDCGLFSMAKLWAKSKSPLIDLRLVVEFLKNMKYLGY